MKRQTQEQYVQRWVMTEALRRAKADVLAQLKREGRKLHEFSAKEIYLRAEAHLNANYEVMLTQAVERLVQRHRSVA